MSVLASNMFEIDIEGKSQNQFMIFIGQKNHTDKDVLQAREFIENNPTRMDIGRRTFERKFKKCTGDSIAEYIQRGKVAFTKKQLKSNKKTVN